MIKTFTMAIAGGLKNRHHTASEMLKESVETLR